MTSTDGYDRKFVVRCREGLGRVLEWTGRDWDPYKGLLFDERPTKDQLDTIAATRPAGAPLPKVETVTFLAPRTAGPQLPLPPSFFVDPDVPKSSPAAPVPDAPK